MKTEKSNIPLIEKGSGKPLIFLHGYMCSKEFFASQIEFFSKTHKVIAYDLYGFGKNLPMQRAYSLDDYVQEFFEVASNCGEKVSVVAHSFGCRVILKALSKKQGNIIEKALLCGVAGLKPKFSFKKTFKRRVYKILKPFAPKAWLEKKFFSSDYNIASGYMKQTFKIVTSEYLDEYLKQIQIPLFLIFGERDDQTPPAIAKKIKKQVANCGVHIMQECSHFCFLEKPNEFNYVAKEFLL